MEDSGKTTQERVSDFEIAPSNLLMHEVQNGVDKAHKDLIKSLWQICWQFAQQQPILITSKSPVETLVSYLNPEYEVMYGGCPPIAF